MRALTIVLPLTCALLATGPGVSTAPATPSATTVVAVPGRSNAFASIAGDGSFVALVWGATTQTTTDVYVAISRDGGRSFGTPVLVSDAATRASLAGEQPPRVALVPGTGSAPAIVAVWTTKGAAGTRLMLARSADGGQSFARPVLVPGTDAPGSRGWQSIAVDPQGRVIVVWLDHRETASDRTGSGTVAPHQHAMPAAGAAPEDSVARAQRSKLYVAIAGEPGSARAITGGVCYCCKTSVAVAPDGAIVAAWRHVYPGNLRDIAFSVSRDRGRTFTVPTRVSEDGWAIDGCPENGPAVAVEGGGRVHVVWPTVVSESAAAEPVMRLFHATTTEGQRFTPRQPIPTEGVPRHPQVARWGAGNLLLVWDEAANATRRVASALGVRAGDGTWRFTRRTLGDTTRGEYPVVAATRDGLVTAWTSGEAQSRVIRVERTDR